MLIFSKKHKYFVSYPQFSLVIPTFIHLSPRITHYNPLTYKVKPLYPQVNLRAVWFYSYGSFSERTANLFALEKIFSNSSLGNMEAIRFPANNIKIINSKIPPRERRLVTLSAFTLF